MELKPLAAFVFLILTLQPEFINGQDPEKKKEKVPAEVVNKFLDQYDKYKQVTFYQLQQWFDAQNKNASKKTESVSTDTQISSSSSSQTSQTSSDKLSPLTRDLYPRLFPFCVTYEQIMNKTLVKQGSHLKRFEHVFRVLKLNADVQKFYDFLESNHSIVTPNKFIKEIQLSRINTPEPDMVNLRQWIHISIRTEDLKGLYVQSVAGPIGLPIGEFSVEFPCDDLPESSDISKVGELHYCHYRPKSSIYHPKVYVGYSDEPIEEFHMHFRWTDITCMETPYLQFLMIGVKNFIRNPKEDIDFKPLLSKVYLNTGFDSLDGSPYPFYPSWVEDGKKMYCAFTSQDGPEGLNNVYINKYGQNWLEFRKENGDHEYKPIRWEASDDISKVQPNEEYDACIRGLDNPTILAAKDDYRLECPPGPFQCDESYKGAETGTTSVAQQDKVQKERLKLVMLEQNTSDCYPCAPPPCVELHISQAQCKPGYKPVDIVNQNDTNVLEKAESLPRSKSHGMLAVLACLVFLPIANFMSRNYKEVCRNCCCGNGPWIFVHIFCHVISVIIMWISIGPIISSISSYSAVENECQALYGKDTPETHKCQTERSIWNPHVPMGILVFFLQNLLMVSGFFRSSKNTLRMIQLIVHSHLGYFAFLLAGVSALLAASNNHCTELVALLSFLFILPILFFFIACMLDFMSDRKVGISPGRTQWPVLEPIKLDKRGPMEPCKCLLLIVFVLSLLVAWFMVVVSSRISSRIPQKQIDKFSPTGGVGLAETFSSDEGHIQGLFGACGTLAE